MVIILYLWYIQNGAPKLLLMAQPLNTPVWVCPALGPQGYTIKLIDWLIEAERVEWKKIHFSRMSYFSARLVAEAWARHCHGDRCLRCMNRPRLCGSATHPPSISSISPPLSLSLSLSLSVSAEQLSDKHAVKCSWTY